MKFTDLKLNKVSSELAGITTQLYEYDNPTNLYNQANAKIGYFIEHTNGNEMSNVNAAYFSYPVVGGSTYKTNASEYNFDQIAFYDKNNNYLSGMLFTSASDTTFQAPPGAVLAKQTLKYPGELIATTVQRQVSFKVDIIDNNNQPFIPSILCIGDSLTQGDYGSDPEGTANVHSENYPYYMSKMLNCNVVNAGVCGDTTTAYWQNKIKNITLADNDIIIIMLGTNGGLTDTLTSDTTIPNWTPNTPYPLNACITGGGYTYKCTQAGTSDYTPPTWTNGTVTDGSVIWVAVSQYEGYADTYTGDYCKIIEYCLEQTNKKAQIFLCTPPHVGTKRQSHRDLVSNAYNIVYKIANRYNLPVVDVYKEGGFSDFNQDVMQPIDNLHFGKLGYQRLGTFIGSNVKAKLSYIMDATI